ncbi:hypothetical protein NST68_22590 [Paenibacillus sp. FSL E2-0230]|uniref:hypothetical protein n=2 Tax=unclassified Paenibacillus TaxID=185978 RepID=UPI0030CBE106
MVRIKAVRTDHSWESVLGRFLEYKRAEGLRSRHSATIRSMLPGFMRRYPGAGAKSDRLAEAAFECLAEDVAPSTYNNRLIYLRTFFSWCVERGIIGSNPITNIKKRKAEPRVVSID